MKKIFYILFLFLTVFSCNEKSSNPPVLIFQGEFSGFQNAKKLSFFAEEIDTSFLVQPNELTEIHLPLTNKQYFYFQLGREYGTIYGEPGDTVSLRLDYKNFDESLKFSGTKSNENNYLIKNYLFREKQAKPLKQDYNKSYTEFDQEISEIHQSLNDLLNQYSENGLDEEFIENEQARNQLFYFKKLVFYPSEYKIHTGKMPELSDAFFTAIDSINTENENYLSFETYPAVISEKLSLQKPILDKKNKDYALQLGERMASIENKAIREQLFFRLLSREIKLAENEQMVNQLLSKYEKNIEDDSLQEELKEHLTKREQLQPGKEAPVFEVENTKKEPVQISDFKGKLLYIDFWATWCKPCREEMPHLNELIEEYKNEEVVFLGVNLDRSKHAYQNWSLFLAEHQLNGVQTIALNNQKAIIDQYNVYAIPRYVLIDQQGEIINAMAPKPSEKEELRTLLNQHL